MYDGRDLVRRYTAVPYASTLRHVNLCNVPHRSAPNAPYFDDERNTAR